MGVEPVALTRPVDQSEELLDLHRLPRAPDGDALPGRRVDAAAAPREHLAAQLLLRAMEVEDQGVPGLDAADAHRSPGGEPRLRLGGHGGELSVRRDGRPGDRRVRNPAGGLPGLRGCGRYRGGGHHEVGLHPHEVDAQRFPCLPDRVERVAEAGGVLERRAVGEVEVADAARPMVDAGPAPALAALVDHLVTERLLHGHPRSALHDVTAASEQFAIPFDVGQARRDSLHPRKVARGRVEKPVARPYNSGHHNSASGLEREHGRSDYARFPGRVLEGEGRG